MRLLHKFSCGVLIGCYLCAVIIALQDEPSWKAIVSLTVMLLSSGFIFIGTKD